MNKINKIAVVILGLIFPLASAQADIKSDLASNLPFEKVIKNGLNSGLPMSVTLVKIFSSTPEDQRISIVSAAISVSPLDVQLIVRTAIRAGVDAEEVVAEAVALAPLEKKTIVQTAIKSGADVTDVTLASAEGLARAGITLSTGGALGAFDPAPAVYEGGEVAPLNHQRTAAGGARPPIKSPDVGISPS